MEANGDFEKAIDELRKKGQKVAANRADREAKEGYIVAKTNNDATNQINWRIIIAFQLSILNQSFSIV